MRAAPMPPEERRQAIVEAVIPLLVRHGAAVTTRQIAEAAGVAEGTIYRAFPDKCALVQAAAEATLDPADGRRMLAEIDPGLGLRDTIRELAAQLLERMEKVVAVMIAVRGVVLGPDGAGAGHPPQDGPPAFIVEANRVLLATLTEVFERFPDELDVAPERAALMLRSLAFGSRHPGMDHGQTLTADEIATVLVSGITGTGRP